MTLNMQKNGCAGKVIVYILNVYCRLMQKYAA